MRALRPLLLLALALAVILALRGALPSVDAATIAQMPAPVIAALIGVGGALTGALGGFSLWLAQDRARRRDAAAEALLRRRRTVAALRAETSFNLRALRQSFDPRYNAERLRGYCAVIDAAARGEGGMPIGVATEESVLFELNKPNLSELPEVLAEALISYHQHDRALAQIIAGRFDATSPPRRKRVLHYYHAVGQSALLEALQARALLDAYIAGGEPLSTPAAMETHLSTDEAALRDLLADEAETTDHLSKIFATVSGVTPPRAAAKQTVRRRLSNKRKDRS